MPTSTLRTHGTQQHPCCPDPPEDSSDDRQREIADALNQQAREELKRDKGKAAGQGAGNDRARSGHDVAVMPL